jgi:hypothetical protein
MSNIEKKIDDIIDGEKQGEWSFQCYHEENGKCEKYCNGFCEEFINFRKQLVNLFEDEKSNYLSEISDDLDNTVSFKTFTTAINFIKILTDKITDLIPPKINYCNNNTIDFSFRNKINNSRLLINIDETGKTLWYGYNNISGDKIDNHNSDIDGLIIWVREWL